MSTIKTGFLIGLGIVAAFFLFGLLAGGLGKITGGAHG
jgi:hypothetical protein